MASDHKGRFGVFAALPLPDVEGSLREIEYAFDVLKADGIGLVTNFGDVYPGDPSIAAVFDELNRRKAVVYFHPTSTACCANLLPGLPAPLIEFAFDTTRAIVSLLTQGTVARCPDIRFIFSHGGGALPMLAGRIAGIAKALPALGQKFPAGLMPEFKRLHYDVVSLFDPIAFNAAKSLVGTAQLLFGTDYPYWDPTTNLDALAAQTLDGTERRAIERENAIRLLPQLGRTP
jgi:predicted TIM-barrel fold metal-dependent hydrolase